MSTLRRFCRAFPFWRFVLSKPTDQFGSIVSALGLSAKCSAISRVRWRRPTPSHTSRPVCPHRPQTNQPKSVLCHDRILRTPACLWHLSQPERKRECLFARCDPQLGVCRKPVYAPKLLGTLQHASRACAWLPTATVDSPYYSALCIGRSVPKSHSSRAALSRAGVLGPWDRAAGRCGTRPTRTVEVAPTPRTQPICAACNYNAAKLRATVEPTVSYCFLAVIAGHGCRWPLHRSRTHCKRTWQRWWREACARSVAVAALQK